jgi:hypothetical protein
VKALRDDMHLLTGSYALDALSDLEQEDFGRHLQACPPCEAEVRGLRETAARLAMAKALRPPPGMQARVLAATYRTRQLPPATVRRPGQDQWPARMARPGRERSPGRHLAGGRPAGGRLATGQPGGGRMPRLAAAVAAASMAAAVALGATQALTQHQLDAARADNAAIARIATAPDARVATTRTSAGGTVTIIVSAGQRAAVIATAGMASLPHAEIYQLWVISPAGARSAGLLSRAGQAGPMLASGVRPGDRIGITVEPSGGTSSPTTTPVVAVPVPA